MNRLDHLNDAELLVYLDGAANPVPTVEHLQQCDQCGERLATLRARTNRLADWFRLDDQLELDHDLVPEGISVVAQAAESASVGRRSTRWALSSRARIAAALALLIGGLSMTPLRAVVTDWIGAVLGGPPTEAPVATVVDPSVFSFDVSGPAFEIRVPGVQSTGRLVVTIDDVTRGSASVVGGDGTEEIVLRAGAARLDVLVGSSPEAEYRIVLPAHVAEVTVVLPTGAQVPLWAPDAESIPRTWSVRLGGR